MSSVQGVKRRTLSKACFLCQKFNAPCDEQQPCGRCISQNSAHMCFFTDDSKKRSSSATEPTKDTLSKDNRRANSSNSDDILTVILSELRDMREDQRRLHDDVRLLRAQQDKFELLLQNRGNGTSSSSNSNGVGSQHYTNGINSPESPNGRQYHPYSISHDHAHGTHQNGCPRCAIDEANATPSPSASAKLGNLGGHLGYPHNTTTPTSSTLSNTDPNWSALTTTGGNSLGRNGTTVNGLMDIMEQLKSNGTRQFGLPTTGNAECGTVVTAQKNTDGAKLTLVFDLTAQPPTVISAPDNFCRMMGYEMHEVMNMPWHKFIHPSNVHRTMNILNQAHMSTTIQFPQIYKTKDGHMFRTLDTHNIVYESGRPIYDIVSIALLPSKVSIKERTRPKEPSTAVARRYANPMNYASTINSSPNTSPSISAEIPSPALEEIQNNGVYDTLNHPIIEDILIEDLNISSPTTSYMNYPSSTAPSPPLSYSSPSISNPPMTPHAPFTLDPSPPPPSPSPSPGQLSNPLSSPHLSHNLSSSTDFDGNMQMDDEELYRILTNEV